MDPDVHSGVLNFRAFLLSKGIDADYTTAINLLAGNGFKQLQESGFGTGIMKRLGEKIPLDSGAKGKLPGDWRKWVRSRGRETTADEGLRLQAGTAKPTHIARGRLNPVTGTCLKCKTTRQMKNPHEVTTKSGKTAIQGTCPDCGTGMFRFGRLASAR